MLGSTQFVQGDPNRASLGKYRLVAELGRGGMATAYLALVVGPGSIHKLFVLKVLKNEFLSHSEGGVDVFWDEARLAARLVHPNIVHTYEVGEVQGRYFLAMEYLEGQSYRAVQRRAVQERLPLEEEVRILSEVARGLHYAHELKDFDGRSMSVVHRDISPHNVFVTYDGQVKLLDFGIAKTLDAIHQTRVGVIKGKLDYIAPEQLRGEAVDARADIFALGVMLWEAVTGRRFAGGRGVTEAAKMHLRLTGGEPQLRALKPDVPEPLAAIVDRAIALDPEARFKDAASFAAALEDYLEAGGMRPSSRSLSGIVTAMFEDDRRTVHGLIEQQIRAMKRGHSESGESFDLLARDALHGAGSSSTPPPSGSDRPFAELDEGIMSTEGAMTSVLVRSAFGRAVAVIAGIAVSLAIVGLAAAATVGVGVLLMEAPGEREGLVAPAADGQAAASGATAAGPITPAAAQSPFPAGGPREVQGGSRTVRVVLEPLVRVLDERDAAATD